MSNLLLKQLRENGHILDDVVPFAMHDRAQARAERLDCAVMIVRSDMMPNLGPYWVVSKPDAERLKAVGYEEAPPVVKHDPPLAM